MASNERQSQAVSFTGGPEQTRIQQVGGGYVNPDYAETSVQRMDDGKSQVLDALLGEGKRLLDKGYQNSLERAYLDGVAKVGQVQSEAELEGDMFTRDWRVAGYRDTMGKFAIAEVEAQIAVDMESQRQQTPEQFQKYLAEKRAKLLPSLDGMSQEQRKASFQQLALSTSAAIKTHTSEHAKFIVETETQAVQSMTGTSFAMLGKTLLGKDPSAYAGAVKNTYGVIHANIWQNPKLNRSLRESLTVQAAEQALNTGSLELYTMMQEQPITVNGKDDTMFNMLSMDKQEALSAKYRAARDRLNAARNTDFTDKTTELEFQFAQGKPITFDEAKAHMNRGTLLGWSEDKRASFYGKWLDAAYKGNSSVLMADAYLGNRTDVIAKYGTPEQARDAAIEAMRKGKVSIEEQHTRHLQAGANKMLLGYKSAGKLANDSIAQYAKADGKVDPNHASMIAEVHKTLDGMKTDPIAEIQYLSSFTDENRLRLQRLRMYRTKGMNEDQAVAQILQDEVSDAKYAASPGMKAAIAGATAVEDRKFLESMHAQGTFGNTVDAVKAFFGSAEGQLAYASRVEQTGLIDRYVLGRPAFPEPVLQAMLANSKNAITDEFMDSNLSYSNVSREDKYKGAAARVESRSAHTKNAGAVIVPKGQTVQSYFGTNADASGVALAIDSLLKPSKPGNTFMVLATHNRLEIQEYDDKGVPTDSKYAKKSITPDIVAERVKERINAQSKLVDTLVGAGKKFVKGDAAVAYNGSNSANVPLEDMLQFRDNLVKHERVRNKVYSDASNTKLDRAAGEEVFTVGVGVSSTNEFYPAHGLKVGETVPQEAINESFRAASNKFAQQAVKIQQQYKLNRSGWLFAAEIGYQGGPSTRGVGERWSVYKDMWTAMQNKDQGQAIKTFSNSPVFKMSDPVRKAHYLKLIIEATKG